MVNNLKYKSEFNGIEFFFNVGKYHYRKEGYHESANSSTNDIFSSFLKLKEINNGVFFVKAFL